MTGSTGITVRELTEIPYLRTRFIAGEGGDRNRISWAHSVEIEDPWGWLQEGDLLMTTGLNVPADPSVQVDFVKRLVEAGLSGLAIGENMNAPDLAAEMLRAADDHGLPILMTSYEVPFVQLARAVASATARTEQRRLVQAARIYEAARESAARGERGAAVVQRLNRVLGHPLFLASKSKLTPILEGLSPPPADVIESALAAIAEEERGFRGYVRFESRRHTGILLEIPTPNSRVLMTWSRSDRLPPLALLQHVASLAALEVERGDLERASRQERGSRLLTRLLKGQTDPASAMQELSEAGVPEGELVLASLTATGAPASQKAVAEQLYRELGESRIPNIAVRTGLGLQVVITWDEPRTRDLIELVADRSRIGFSDPFASPSGIPEAAREADWAVGVALSEDREVIRYSDRSSLLGPRSLREARTLVARTLGALMAYDRENQTDLLYSLATFLRHNRSWKVAAEELSIHKQTLVYRMRRVEEITGKRLDRMDDTVELWYAVRAASSIDEVRSTVFADLEIA